MNETSNISSTPPQIGDALPYILNAISQYFKDFANRIDADKELLGAGAKTELISQIETNLINPLQNLAEYHQQITESANRIINSAVKLFLSENKNIIHYACLTDAKPSLHYSILLKEDTPENRKQIFSFFEHYDLQDFSQQFPVYFQFLTPDIKADIPATEVIIE